MFSVLISDLGGGIRCTFNKFAGSTKLGRVAGAAEGSAAIQKDLDRLEKWTDKTFKKLSTRTFLLCPV